MQMLMSLFTFLLALLGLAPQPGITTLSVSSVDGVQVNSTKAVVNGGDARFECLRSASGRCHYVVFAGECRPSSNPVTVEEACAGVVVERFVLLAGETRQLRAMPGKVRFCMDHDAIPAGPGCMQG